MIQISFGIACDKIMLRVSNGASYVFRIIFLITLKRENADTSIAVQVHVKCQLKVIKVYQILSCKMCFFFSFSSYNH